MVASFHRCFDNSLFWHGFYLVALTAAAAGCSNQPARVRPPDISASQAGASAMQEYDTNSDGQVAGDELEHAPSLKAALATLDQNGDGAVTADEVAARVEAWQHSGKGLTTIRCLVLLDGQPLEGAQVTFEPESFLGDEVQTAVGVSNRFGKVSPVIPKDQRPSPETPPGLALGLYKVRISKMVGGREQIPSQYNTATIFGQQVAFDDPAMLNNRVVFELSNKK